MKHPTFNHISAVAAFLLANAADLAAAPSYRVVDLGLINPFATPSASAGINASGQVAGIGGGQAFIGDGHSIAAITIGLGLTINDSNQVAGFAYDFPRNDSMQAQAFRWNGSAIQKLGIPNSFGLGINNLGQVSGALDSTGNTDYRAFIWDGTTPPQVLGTLGGSSSYGSGINDSGWSTGASDTGDNGAIHAFVWNGNTMRDIGTLGGEHLPSSYGVAINEQGWVTGWSFHYDADWNIVNRAFLWDGTMHDLGSLSGASETYGYGINSLGQVVGSSIDYGGMMGFGYGKPNPKDFAFLYANGELWKLNELIDPTSTGWSILLATGINDNGQIAASGCHPQLGCRALRLDP
ncbi:MAG: DUF3466 family protein, partial [Methylomonas sp.]|nr:DUF3466 family protein [Methylomonas sp.]